MTDNLLPCPFCGDKARYCGTDDRGFVECMNIDCGAETGLDYTEASAVARWNRRATAAPNGDAKPAT